VDDSLNVEDVNTTLKKANKIINAVEAAEGRTAHNNVWNRANGTASNHI
jgi:hypothetical protein